VLKCDIKKFFASIDHATLLTILSEHIPDAEILSLLKNIIGSFRTVPHAAVGLPLGNLTSQLFANIYMNSFDQWVKHELKAKYYIRYADDFVFLSEDKAWLLDILPKVREFLMSNLRLTLHPDKIFLKTVASGLDFLGWVHFSDHRVLRRTTQRRMFARIGDNPTGETVQSTSVSWDTGTRNDWRVKCYRITGYSHDAFTSSAKYGFHMAPVADITVSAPAFRYA
jgi:hypothetical protein